MDRETFRGHVVKLLDFYRRQGVVRPEGRLVAAAEIYPGIAEARMAFQMLGGDGRPVAVWEHFYVLRRTAGWRVTLTIADAEMAAWNALGAEL